MMRICYYIACKKCLLCCVQTGSSYSKHVIVTLLSKLQTAINIILVPHESRLRAHAQNNTTIRLLLLHRRPFGNSSQVRTDSTTLTKKP